jgi:hypothetical protein
VSNLETRGASIGVAFKKPKLLIFPFLVRTSDEGVFRAFLLGVEAGLPETVDERGSSRVGISPDFRLTGDQCGTIRVTFS